jgi:hypothetical protein
MRKARQCEGSVIQDDATPANHYRRALVDSSGDVWWATGPDSWQRRNGSHLTEAGIEAAYGPVEQVVLVPVDDWRLNWQELADLRQDRDEAVECLSRSATAAGQPPGRQVVAACSASTGDPPRNASGELTVDQWVRLQLTAAALHAGRLAKAADVDELAAYVLGDG